MVPVSPTASATCASCARPSRCGKTGSTTWPARWSCDWLAEGWTFTSPSTTSTSWVTRREFTTYPIVDPEIVVIASNPVGGIGIGIDPTALRCEFGPTRPGLPCHDLPDPFDMAHWENLPGLRCHHESSPAASTSRTAAASAATSASRSTVQIDPVPGHERLLPALRPRQPRVRALPDARPRRRRRRRPLGRRCPPTTSWPTTPIRLGEQVRLDAGRRGLRAPDEPVPRRERRRRRSTMPTPCSPNDVSRRRHRSLPGPAPRRPPLRVQHRVAPRLPAAGPRAPSRTAYQLGADGGNHHASEASAHGPVAQRRRPDPVTTPPVRPPHGLAPAVRYGRRCSPTRFRAAVEPGTSTRSPSCFTTTLRSAAQCCSSPTRAGIRS